ncbi:hypothetical protein HYV84_06230 [Candidatus Woesearchaeota archaeon]|nr:hypothetical protein [Candidatus Woesearchaeota archaeon]
MGEILEDLRETCFVSSFKVDKRFFLVLGMNVAVVIGILLVWSFWNAAMAFISANFQGEVAKYENILPYQGQTELPEFVRQPLGIIQYQFDRLVFRGIGATIIFLFLMMLIVAVGKGYSWGKLLGKKLQIKKAIFFSLSLTLWVILWAGLFVLIALGVKQNLQKYLGVFLVAVFSYLTLLFIPLFMETQKPLRSIWVAASLGIKKIHLFLPPLIIMLLLGVALYLILLPLVAPLHPALILIILITALFSYLSWTDWYLALVIKKVYRNE